VGAIFSVVPLHPSEVTNISNGIPSPFQKESHQNVPSIIVKPKYVPPSGTIFLWHSQRGIGAVPSTNPENYDGRGLKTSNWLSDSQIDNVFNARVQFGAQLRWATWLLRRRCLVRVST